MTGDGSEHPHDWSLLGSLQASPPPKVPLLYCFCKRWAGGVLSLVSFSHSMLPPRGNLSVQRKGSYAGTAHHPAHLGRAANSDGETRLTTTLWMPLPCTHGCSQYLEPSFLPELQSQVFETNLLNLKVTMVQRKR